LAGQFEAASAGKVKHFGGEMLQPTNRLVKRRGWPDEGVDAGVFLCLVYDERRGGAQQTGSDVILMLKMNLRGWSFQVCFWQ
jgi:hypothetical protein